MSLSTSAYNLNETIAMQREADTHSAGAPAPGGRGADESAHGSDPAGGASSSAPAAVKAAAERSAEDARALAAREGMEAAALARTPMPVLPFSGAAGDYAGWAMQAKAALDCHELLPVVMSPLKNSGWCGSVLGGADDLKAAGGASQVSGGAGEVSPAALRSSKKVFSWLLQCLKGPELLRVMTDVEQGNAHALWQRLHSIYVGSTQAHKSLLQQEFHSLQRADKEPVMQFMSRLRSIGVSLKAHNEEPSDSAMVYAFTNGLGAGFEMVRAMLPMHAQFSLEALFNLVLVVEAQQVADRARAGHQEQAHWASASGGAAGADRSSYSPSRPPAGGRGAGGAFTGDCFYCQKKGHRKIDCPKYLALPPCGKCGKRGHAAAVCRSGGLMPGAGQQQAAPAGGQALGAPRQESAMANTYYAEAQFVLVQAMAATAQETEQPGYVPLFLDSGSSKHIVTSALPLRAGVVMGNVVIRVANGELLRSPTVGSLRLEISGGGRLSLTNVLSHAGMSTNLLSVSAMCDNGCSVLYSRAEAVVFKSDKSVLLVAKRVNDVYVVNARAVDGGDTTGALQHANAAEVESASAVEHRLWHERLGHLSESGLQMLQRADAVIGLCALRAHAADEVCPSCMRGKAHRAPFADSIVERAAATRPLARVWADICGPFPPSRTGKLYMLLLVDEFSGMVFGWCLVHKSDAAPAIKAWCRAVAVQRGGRGLVEFHSDNGGEFVSSDLKAFFAAEGIRATTTVPHTPQHNGRVERKNRTIVEGVQAMLQRAEAPKMLWADAVLAFIHVHNRSALRKGTLSTYDALWEGGAGKPSVAGLRVLFCDAWVHTPDSQRATLESKAELGVFIGYDTTRQPPAYLVLQQRRVVTSRDVRFEEGKFTQAALLSEAYGRDDVPFERDMERLAADSALRQATMWSLQTAAAEDRSRAAEAEAAQSARAEQTPAAAEAQLAEPQAAPVAAPIAVLPAAAAGAPQQQASASSSGVSPFAAQAPPADESMRRSARALKMTPKMTYYSASLTRRATMAAYSSAPAAEERAAPAALAAPAAPGAEASSSEAARPYPARSNRSALAHYGKVNWADVDYSHPGLFAEARESPARRSWKEEMELALHVSTAALQLQREPKSYAEARASAHGPRWEEAFDSELASMEKHQCWVLCELPPGRRALGSKWVLKYKFDALGTIKRFKARIVVLGYLQREFVDFNETFAPVLFYTTLRVLLVVAAVLDLELLQMDVPTAFLNASVDEEIYMEPPPGLKGVRQGQVCRLLRSLYGLKQAPRQFNKHVNNEITALGYTRLSADTCMYMRLSRSGRPMYFAIFVDDLIPACSSCDLAELRSDIGVLVTRYGITEVIEAGVILGMRVTRDRRARTITLDQEIYANKILETHGMADAKQCDTPEEVRPSSEEQRRRVREMRSDEQEEAVIGLKHYSSIVGQLMYAAVSTRPDLAHAVGVLARSLKDPKVESWRACKRVLRYVKGTAARGLVFGGRGPADRIVLAPTFCDADWAGDLEDRRSTSGYVMKVNGSPVSWLSKKQASVALSSCEAEYMAAGAATQEIMWLRTLLAEMGHPQAEPTVLLCDNQSAIALSSDDVHHARTKHIDLRHHFIRERIVAGELRLQWVPSEQQEADILTKGLAKEPFVHLRALVMGGEAARAGSRAHTITQA